MTTNNVVLFERINENVALITLNRPEKRNAVNQDLAQGLWAAVQEVEKDPKLRVAILAANGSVFCAGADLAEVAAGRKLGTPEGGFAGFVYAPRTKPWIAAIAGTAFGGGCELALTCDMVIAGEEAQFGLPEVKRGVLAAAGGAFRIARVLPRPVAIELALTGRGMPAKEALGWGLVNQVVPTADVIKAATELANTISANAPLSVQATLALAREAADQTEAELWKLTQQHGMKVMTSEDAKEGPRAFLEKRAPNWQGR
jgi:enoyl-CoA hydratase/carnithine racemase